MERSDSLTGFRLKRFGAFIKKLLRTWQGALGLMLILGFIFVSIFAPFITPYTPLGQDPTNKDRYLSGERSAPSWLRFIPTFLGGEPHLSGNTAFVKDPGLPRLKEWSSDGEWIFGGGQGFTCGPSQLDYPVEKTPMWFRHSPQNGSIAVNYSRGSPISPNATYSTTLFVRVSYDDSGPPKRWTANIGVLVNGSQTVQGRLGVPVLVRVFIQCENGTRFTLWQRSFIKPTYWVFPQSSWESSISYMDSNTGQIREVEPRFQLPKDPVVETFTKTPGTYLYGAEIYMNDTKGFAGSASTTVYIDDFSFDTLGNAWGILGTDALGRDIFSQLVYGTRISLIVGVLVAVMGVVIGLAVGLSSGYVGGVVDQFAMRINDLLLVLPGLPMLIVLVAVLGARLENLIIFLGLLGWMGFARVVRSQTLSLKERPFVEAAKASGASTPHILVSHILPNVMALVYISLATSVPGAITAEAALSFLGFFDPLRMSWGRMLREATDAGALNAWWWIIPPGLMISILAVAFILLGFALDDVLNPKLRIRR